MSVGAFLIIFGVAAFAGIGAYYYLSGEEETEDMFIPPEGGDIERPGPGSPIEREMPIEEMDLGGRTLSVLQERGFETRKDLLRQGDDFTEIKGIGESRSEDIEQAIVSSYED